MWRFCFSLNCLFKKKSISTTYLVYKWGLYMYNEYYSVVYRKQLSIRLVLRWILRQTGVLYTKFDYVHCIVCIVCPSFNFSFQFKQQSFPCAFTMQMHNESDETAHKQLIPYIAPCIYIKWPYFKTETTTDASIIEYSLVRNARTAPRAHTLSNHSLWATSLVVFIIKYACQV